MMKEKDYRTIILKSAEEIINCRGMKALTIANIVRKSQISNRNFYEYFSSKEELLEELKILFNGMGIKIQEERQLILEKAEEGISHYGFNNITLEIIAKESGLKRGAIYKHFSDKYELLECCIEYQFNKIRSTMDMIYRAGSDCPEEFLKNYIESFRSFLNTSYDSTIYTEAWSHLNYRQRIRALCLELQEHLRKSLIKSLKKGMEQGIFKKDLDVETVTDFMLMTLNGMSFYLGKEIKTQKIRKQSTDLILDTFLRMIRTEQ